MGRPSKYDPKYCEEILEHMAQGYSKESFAGKIGIARSTLYLWAEEHTEFSDTIKIAEAACLYFWERQGNAGMFAPKEFNSAIWIFNMKARFGWKDQEPATPPPASGDQSPKLSKEEILELAKAIRGGKE